jgi:hypothetical protein
MFHNATTNEDRKNQQATDFSYLSERNQNDNDSTITVKRKYIFILFFFKFLLKLYQAKSHIKCAPITEVLSAEESNRISVRSKSESYYNISQLKEKI